MKIDGFELWGYKYFGLQVGQLSHCSLCIFVIYSIRFHSYLGADPVVYEAIFPIFRTPFRTIAPLAHLQPRVPWLCSRMPATTYLQRAGMAYRNS